MQHLGRIFTLIWQTRKVRDFPVKTEFSALVKRARAGDKEAFGALYGELYPDLYRFAYCALRSAEDAEDAVAEAVTDAFYGIGKLRNEEAFKSWLFRITAVKCKKMQATYYHMAHESIQDLPLAAEAPQTEEFLDLQAAFATLAPDERLILSLSVFGGYNSADIASMICVNRNTVRSKHSRSLQKMRELMKEDVS